MHYTTQQIKCIVAICKKIHTTEMALNFSSIISIKCEGGLSFQSFQGPFLKQCKQWLSSLLGHPSKPGHKIALRRGNISPLEWHTRNSVEVTFDYKALATTLGLEKANTPVMFVVPWRASCMQNKYILCFKWYSIFFSSLETCHACDLCSVIFIRPTSL